MSGTDIFLSYARADRPAARMIADCLADEGFSVWWDASLRSGETFDEVIERNLRDAKAVIVLWSPRSVASRWVRAEATLADRRDKLAPAIIEACDLPIIFELKHASDLCGWTGDVSDPRWRSFVSDLQGLIEAGGHPAAQRPAPAAEAPAKPAAPAARQPLRPGADEVIFAERPRREEPAPHPVAPVAAAEEPPADGEVHCLEVQEGELPEELILIEAPSARIGRTAPAEIVIAHKSISREHCVIGLANDELFATDLNSTNGTFVDGDRIRRTTVLPVGSVLTLGQISLTHTIYPREEALRRGGLGGPAHDGLQEGRLAAAR